MFNGCTSLTQAPELPAMTLTAYCYADMFNGCTSLTKAPNLPATKLAMDCYSGMFQDCESLSEISVSFSTWDCTSDWVVDVAPTGTFTCPKKLAEIYDGSHIPEGWKIVYSDGGNGLENLSSSNFTIWTEGHTLFVRGTEGLVEVYNLNGQLLRAAQGKSGETIRFILPAEGVFVVKTETKSVKVIL